MRTLVVSDLHLGTGSGADLLAQPAPRERLLGALDGIDRFVILGDAVELRERPARDAVHLLRPLLGEVGGRLGPGGEIVMLSGNHDHALVEPWLIGRAARADVEPLAVHHDIDPEALGPIGVALAGAAGPARLRFAYPGIWLREDVYATHGHFSDVHTTVPTFERLLAGAMARWMVPAPPEEGAGADHYEAVLGPLYAFMDAVVRRPNRGTLSRGGGASSRAWRRLAGRPARARDVPASLALRLGYVAAVRTLARMGIGPLDRRLSGPALTRGGLHGIGEVLARLDVQAGWAIWGHSHRSGPWPDDPAGDWVARNGARILNTGSWVYQPHFLEGGRDRSPYWPGTAIEIRDDGQAPRLLRLLDEQAVPVRAPAPRA